MTSGALSDFSLHQTYAEDYGLRWPHSTFGGVLVAPGSTGRRRFKPSVTHHDKQEPSQTMCLRILAKCETTA